MRHEPPLLTASETGCLMRVMRPALSLSVAVATPVAVVLPFATRNFVMAMSTLSLPDLGGVPADAAGANASSASMQRSMDLRTVSLLGVRNRRHGTPRSSAVRRLF